MLNVLDFFMDFEDWEMNVIGIFSKSIDKFSYSLQFKVASSKNSYLRV